MARKKKNAGFVPLTSPQTREEHYLANIAGLVNTMPQSPYTRLERYLEIIAANSGFSPTEAQLAAINSGIDSDSFNVIANKTLFGYGGNLLINSDFRSPINTRGLTDYLGDTATIDGWFCTGSAMTTSVKNGFIRWTRDATILNPYLRQKVNLNPGTYTFSMLYRTNVNDTSKYHYYFTLGSEREIPNANGESWNLYTKTITTQNTSEYVGIQDLSVYIESAEVNDYIDILAMSFEPGSVSTLAYEDSNGYHITNNIMPRDLNIARCQKFLLELNPIGEPYASIGYGIGVSSTNIRVKMYTPTTMYAVTNITATGNWVFQDYVEKVALIPTSNPSSPRNSGNGIAFDWACSGVTGGRVYLLQANNDSTANMLISAES